MKKFRWLIAAVGLVVLAVGGWFYWRTTKTPSESDLGLKPELSVAAVDINNISDDRIDLTMRLYLRNPYPLELRTRRLDYRVLVDSTLILESAYTEPQTIQSKDSTLLKLPMEVLRKPLTNSIKRFTERGQDSADYTIQATVFADVPVVGEKAFNWEKTKRLPTFQVPTIKLAKLNVDKLGLNHSKLEAILDFTNPNAFTIALEDVKYTLTIGQQDNLKVEGSRAGLTTIPRKSRADVPLQLEVESKQLGKLLGQYLFQQSKTPVELLFVAQSAAEGDFMKGSKLTYKITGTLDEVTGKK